MDILDGLNPQQKQAVENTEGPLLIVAGAGSGKTKVLTHRIAYIIQQNLALSDEILAVTFTNKAAAEMKSRIEGLLTGSNKIVSWCGTFHSICLRILKTDGKEVGLDPNFTIYDSSDSLDAVKEAMDRQMIDKKETSPNAIRATISSAKNDLVRSASYAEMAESYFEQIVAKVYPEYQRILRENNAVDFDDLLLLTTELFDNNPKILGKYQQRFKYILVDEYQDTNRVQYKLIRQLATGNICVVGDDDQSIYKFRGADISNILSFEKDFPKAKIIKLEQNYRSTQNILDASYAVVRHNQERRDKKLWTESGTGEKIRVHTAIDENDEGNWVASEIEQKVKTGTKLSDIVVLYRTNAQSRAIEEALIRCNLPYKIVGGIKFYDRKEVKDILAYLRIIVNHKDILSLRRIINSPRRGIGDKTVDGLIETANEFKQSPIQYLVNESESIDNKKLHLFSLIVRKLIENLSSYKLSDFIKFVLEQTGYFDYLNDGTIEGQGRIENLNELISMASEYDENPNTNMALPQFLDDIALIEDSQRKQGEVENGVTLMTIHAAKGLEFEVVFIVGMEEMLFPHARAYTDNSELEEERRLAYVALTRAKKQIYAIHAESRRQYGKLSSNPPSRFLNDIPAELIERSSTNVFIRSSEIFEDYFKEEPKHENYYSASIGERVKHPVFGIGEILDINDSTVKIKFPLPIGIKELAVEYARLEKA